MPVPYPHLNHESQLPVHHILKFASLPLSQAIEGLALIPQDADIVEK
jgi:hypothetical protein